MEFLNDLQLYFRGEKVESAVILLISLALLLASVALIFWVRQPFTKGLGTVLLLAEKIRASGSARIISVSSIAHFFGRINFGDLNSEHHYNATLAYGQSKLANLLFVREFQRRLESAGITATSAAAHPGSTRTNLQQHSKLMHQGVALFSHEAPAGALPTLYAATAPDVVGGEYFGPRGLFGCIGPPGRARSGGRSKDMRVARRLWEVSERLTDVSYGI